MGGREAAGTWHRCVLTATHRVTCARASVVWFDEYIPPSQRHVKMRLFFSSLCLLLWSCLWGSAYAKSAMGDRVLVVMEDEALRGDYAQFWKDLECRPTVMTGR